MALKAVLSSLEDVPEGLKEQYAEAEDGKFVLSVEGMIPETQHNDMKKKLAEFRSNNNKYQQERDEALSRLARFEGVDVEEYRSLKEHSLKLAGKGVKAPEDLELAIKKATEPLEKKLLAQEKAQQELNLSLKAQRIEKGLMEIISPDVKPLALKDAINRAKEIGFDEYEGKIVAMKDGSPVILDNGDYLTPDVWVKKDLLAAAPHLAKESVGGGAQNVNKTGFNPVTKTLTNPTAVEMGKYADDIASGKIKVIRQAK